jgi:hypothetical protein
LYSRRRSELAEVNDAAEVASGVHVTDHRRDVLVELLRERFGEAFACHA